MNKLSIFTAVLIAVVLGLGLASCAKSEDDVVTAQDVEQETRELISTLRQYTANQRDEAVAEAGEALERLDGKINELEARIDNNWESMSQQARQDARANLNRLREQRSELAGWYDSFRNSSAGAWDEMKKGFTDAYQVMSDSWVNARREFEDDNE
ncbi:hypothetical protein [Saccharospirillum alexandrii]|uniref:hypothetical protein n=1 Tax=Saccharospirillum alexandrii TaxID=2448477 RepID=UPI003735584A